MASIAHICTLPLRILFATDLTDLERILPIAIDYTLKCKAALKLVHVLPDATMSGMDAGLPISRDGDALARHAATILDNAVKKATEAGLDCTWDVRIGQVANSIRQMVQHWKADRLIVGTHGAQKFQQELLGSVAESILREVDVPVFAVGPAARYVGQLRATKTRILLATELDRESRSIVDSVLEFARIHRADLTMLHVIPRITEAHPAMLRVQAYTEYIFQETLSSLRSGQSRPTCLIERGEVVETILRVATRGRFDLIFLGMVSGFSFREEIMPGTAYRVMCRAPCPVLILKEERQQDSTGDGAPRMDLTQKRFSPNNINR